MLYELKRIIRSKVTISAMLLGILVTAVSLLFELKLTDIKPKSKRMEYGVITDEKVREELNYLRKNYTFSGHVSGNEMETSLKEDVYRNYYLPRENYFHWIRENYLGFRFNENEFAKLLSDDKHLEDFYKVREENAIAEIKYDKSMNYTSGEMNYLTGLVKNSSGPYRYGEADGYTSAFTFLTLLPVVLLAIGISVGNTYSQDYETGAIEIVTASKHGKMHLCVAKIISVFIFASVSILLISVAFLGILFRKYSFYGGELPIQTLNTHIIFPFTMRELLIKNMVAIFSATLITALGSVFLSRITGRTYVVYGVLLFAYLACRYVGGIWSGGNTAFGKWMELSPFNAGSYQHFIVRVYLICGNYYHYFDVYPVFYAIGITAFILISLLLSKRVPITSNKKSTFMSLLPRERKKCRED